MTCDRDQAALYALGCMAEAEAQAYENHLRDCAACHVEVESLRPLANDLVLAAPEAEPPSSLKKRLLARVRGFSLLRAAAPDWQPTGIDGVDVRVLFLDKENERQTVLVRMAAGASYPCHRHAGVEECYVLQGDLVDGALEMEAGDYISFEEGTQHGPLSTRRGNLLLVMSSTHDELVA